MNIALSLKLFLYRLFSTSFGKAFLRLLSFGIKVKNLGSSSNKKISLIINNSEIFFSLVKFLLRSNFINNKKNYPFLVAVTADTESGYVGKNERRVWQKENPEAFIGYYYGIRNIANIFDKHKIKSTFFLSTQCFSSNGKEYSQIKKELNSLIRKGHEIGLHLHPDSDFAVQKKLSKKFKATSAFFYSYGEKLKIINAAKDLVKEHLGNNIAKKLLSFRWGNWALDTGGAKALQKAGFKIDSSAAPGIKGHLNDGMKYDWSRVSRHYPWKLSITDYQSTANNNSKIMEMPIATFDFFGIKLMANPVNSVLLNKAFIEYYLKADRSKKPFPFVVITHSSEATYFNGKPTQALKDLNEFISMAKKHDGVEFVTLKEAYKRVDVSRDG